MSILEPIDQLINILYNERMKELIEENKRLRSIKTWKIFDENDPKESFAIVCKESELLNAIKRRKKMIIDYGCCARDEHEIVFVDPIDNEKYRFFIDIPDHAKTYYSVKEIEPDN